MEFVHTYMGDNGDGHEEYYCSILNKSKNVVGNCKYYKTDGSDDVVYIEFINIGYEHRRRGYGTAMVKELQSRYELKWDGRFSDVGRMWYDSLVKKSVIKS